MIFSVSNDGIEWSLNFEPRSVPLTVKDLLHEMKESSQEIPLEAWRFLLSQRQDFLNNHPTMDYGDERRSALNCRCTRYGHKRVSGV